METKMRLSLVILTLGLLLPHCVRTDDDTAAAATTAATTTVAPTTPATTTPVPKVDDPATTTAAATTTTVPAVPSSTIAAAATTTKMLPPPPPDAKTTAATSPAAAPSATQNVTPTPSKSPDVSTTKPSGGGGQVLSVPSPNDGQTTPAVPNGSSAVSTTVAKPDDNQSNIAHQGGDSSTTAVGPNSSQQPATTKAPADQVSAIPTAAVSAQPSGSGSGSVTSSTATDAGRGPGTGTTPSTQAGGATTTVYRPPLPSLAPEDNTTTTVPPPTTTALPTTTTMATTAPLESHTHEYIKKEQPEEGEAMLDKICSRLLQLFVDGAKCSMAYRRRGSDKPMFDTVEISGKVNTSIVKSHYDDLQKVPTNDPKESDDQSAHTTLVAILASCGALALIIVGLAICTYRHGKNYRKNQHLTEEMPTVENGYHDNPTLEMEVPTETSPSPLEKKLPRPNGQTSEFNDSWIVPIDNLLKDDMIPDEEDTHL
ncbi:podocalyxin isoform X2 [Engraulis encrasicolus]|uniref:podocalyxin isoform X2 n=1 Tax=Engraulis encrasicolus TaxID=184585 RepID=UPI002FD0ED20